MIVVSTNGDLATDALNGYARALVNWATNNGINLVLHIDPPNSVAARIHLELQNHSRRSFFFFGHGSPGPAGFVAQGGNRAIDTQNVNLLTGRTVSATCCHGDKMGPFANPHQFSLLGHSDDLWIPTAPALISKMQDPALAGPKMIAQGYSPAQSLPVAQQALGDLAWDLHVSNSADDTAFALFAAANAVNIGVWE